MRAWLFQDPRQKKKLGEKKCPWSVGWIDLDGKRIGSKSMAEKFRKKIEGQLAADTYRDHSRKQWDAFRGEYEMNVGSRQKPCSRLSTKIALDHFERLIKPRLVSSIRTATIDEYVTKRRPERGRKKRSTVSPATINKELRHIQAVLKVACDYRYLIEMPKIRMEKEPEKLSTFVSVEHFGRIYAACDVARLPKDQPYSPGDWWRALLVFNYMTGWRIGEPTSLRRSDLDLDAGTAITRHGDNKGGRDERVPLHPTVVEHLHKIQSFEPVVFPWFHHPRGLWSQFLRIQQAAGIHLECHEQHEHTDYCHVYGFHDLRRAFATENEGAVSTEELQKLMRHKSYSTTQRYINMAGKLNKAVQGLHVPDVLKKGAAG